MKVLFIGATGVVGRQVVPELSAKYDLTLAALGGGELQGQPVCDIDITNLDNLDDFLQAGKDNGITYDAVINCAIADHSEDHQSSPEALRAYNESCIEVNARGAYHIYEAAARAEIPLVVYVSSLTIMLGPPVPDLIDASTHDQSKNVYSASKAFGEHVGRYYANRPASHGKSMRVICLRLGQPFKSFCFWDEVWQNSAAARRLAVDCRDIAQAMDCALQSDMNYGVFSIVSDCDQLMVHPELYEALGYRPRWRFSAEGLHPAGDNAASAEGTNSA